MGWSTEASIINIHSLSQLLESEEQDNGLELQRQLSWSGAMLKLKGKERSIFLSLYIFIGVTREKKQELQHCMLEQKKRNYCVVIP